MGVSKFAGGPFGLQGVKFSMGSLDLEKGKALYWHWKVPIFKKINLQQRIIW